MKINLIFFWLLLCFSANAQLDVYVEGNSLITGFWDENGILSEVNTNQPFEGSLHYEFEYNFTSGFWAGIGLNLDNWGASPGRNFSGYSHLRIAYKGLGSTESMTLALQSDAGVSNLFTVGSSVTDYTVVDIPIIALTSGSMVNLEDIGTILISATGPAASGLGTLYFDQIQLINKSVSSSASSETWHRFQQMYKGANLTNWLEAYWLMPSNSFPEVEKFNRTKIAEIANLGFNAIRVPVTFERIADQNPPYALDTNDIVFELIDSTIVRAADYGLSVILTNHHGVQINDANATSEINRKKAIWTTVYEKYNHLNPENHFFELFNEANNISNAAYQPFLDSLITHMRNMGSNHTLVLGGVDYNSVNGLVGMEPLSDDNIIYTAHSYNPYFFTHQQFAWTDPPEFPPREFMAGSEEENSLISEMQSLKDWGGFYDVPVMMGEFGVSSEASLASRCQYINTIVGEMNRHGIPFYYWDVFGFSDGFGFINSGVSEDCFTQVMGIDGNNNCGNIVNSTSENGVGSIRQRMLCVADGDTIAFDNVISGDTIKINGPSIIIGKNITIMGMLGQNIVLELNDSIPLLEIASGKEVRLENLTLVGNEAENLDQLISVKGILNVKNVQLRRKN